LKAWPIFGILMMEGLLGLAHWFLYRTWIAFYGPLGATADRALRGGLTLLAVSFIVAALLGFYVAGLLVRVLYRVAAVWLGMLNFLFFAACVAWAADFVLLLTPLSAQLPQLRPRIALALLAAVLLASLYGLLNARWIRVRRIGVRLDRLPVSWRGRTALVISDVHLGNVLGARFSRRIVALANSLEPDLILIPGDLFDGAKTTPEVLVAPFRDLKPRFGTYFSAGNHDEFGDAARYADALTGVGIHVLHNERVSVDGLQIIGAPYGYSTYPLRLRIFLDGLHLTNGPASILINHVPNRLTVVERAGVSLQLSGHTHGGQIFPFTWFTRRAFGRFIYGLQRMGNLQVLTSSGVGTWGPPMRVGTHSEVVLLRFE